MKITRTSVMTGKVSTREIPVTQEQLSDWTAGRGLIQDIMPNVSVDDREFLISGITPSEWAEAFPPEDEDDIDTTGRNLDNYGSID